MVCVCVCECIINEPREVFERSIIDLFGKKKNGKGTVARTIVYCFLRYVGRLYRFVVSRKTTALFVQSNYNFLNYIVDVTRIKMEISRVRHAFWRVILLIDFAKIDGFKCRAYVIIRTVELIKLVSF